MAISESLTATFSPQAEWAGSDPRRHHQTIVLVQWALAIACAYLVLFSESTTALGLLVIVVFLASNLVVGRLEPSVITTPKFSIGIAVVDAILIALSLAVAGQLSVEVVVLCLGILILAIAGFRMATIATATLGLSVVYLLLVWFGGTESLMRSSMLLRVPFLFTAAIVYAWLVEFGRADSAANAQDAPAQSSGDLTACLTAQLEAIKRSQTAVAEGSEADALSALSEVANQNQAMLTKLAHV